jgi:hypothetical protein
LSVDPLAPSYPWYTPYQFAGNKPIWAVDLDGLEEDIRNVINTRVTPIVDNLKLIPLYSPVSIQRNSGVNGGEYQYLVLFPKFDFTTFLPVRPRLESIRTKGA